MVLNPWPSPQIIQDIVSKSSGYFIYASTIIKFIDDKNFRPTERLAVIRKITEPHFGVPFAALDQLYTQILAQVPARPQLLKILTVIAAHISLPVAHIEQLLKLEPGDVGLALRGLHSVIDVPDDAYKYLNVHHASFRDFLQDPARAGIFYVGGSQHQTDLSRQVLKAFSYKYNEPPQTKHGHVTG
ncbi:hypothetical protein B0H14DRAFT_2551002 [Mycena olivaceomarginata]|nr:hypothetical protein B0H14DRAFT_2551002 [Mycena olivaceomarginata]